LEKFFQEPKIDMLGVRLSDLSRASDKRVFILSRATEPPAPDWYDKSQGPEETRKEAIERLERLGRSQ
jgi:hypothetical protein